MHKKNKKEADPLSPVHSDESSERRNRITITLKRHGAKRPRNPHRKSEIRSVSTASKNTAKSRTRFEKKVSPKRGGKVSEGKLNSPSKKFKTKATERERVKSDTAPRISNKATNHKKQLNKWMYDFENAKESGKGRSSKRKLESCFEHLMNSKLMKSVLLCYDTRFARIYPVQYACIVQTQRRLLEQGWI